MKDKNCIKCLAKNLTQENIDIIVVLTILLIPCVLGFVDVIHPLLKEVKGFVDVIHPLLKEVNLETDDKFTTISTEANNTEINEDDIRENFISFLFNIFVYGFVLMELIYWVVDFGDNDVIENKIICFIVGIGTHITWYVGVFFGLIVKVLGDNLGGLKTLVMFVLGVIICFSIWYFVNWSKYGILTLKEPVRKKRKYVKKKDKVKK